MKTRRALRIVVAVLALLILVCLVAGVAIAQLLPNLLPEAVRTVFVNLTNAVTLFGGTLLGLTALQWWVPILFYGVPMLLWLIGIALLLAPRKGKPGKYVAGSILMLLGVTATFVFIGWFAEGILDGIASDNAPLGGWHVIVRIALGVLFALLLLFVVLSFTAKKQKVKKVTTVTATKQTPVATEPQAETEPTKPQKATVAATQTNTKPAQTEAAPAETAPTTREEKPAEPKKGKGKDKTPATDKTPVKEKAPVASKAPVKEKTPATEYVPDANMSVRDIVTKTYGKDTDELSSANLDKIKKVRILYEAGALTQDEYIALINKYLGI